MAVIKRKDVDIKDTWDLTSLFENDKKWEEAINILKDYSNKKCEFEGKLNNKEVFLKALKEMDEKEILLEKAYSYPFLQQATDATNNDYNTRVGVISNIASLFMAKFSFFVPEVLSLKDSYLEEIYNDPDFKDYCIMLKKIRRNKEHSLTKQEERLIAMQSPLCETNVETFNFLTNVDMKFPKVNKKPLTQSTFSTFLHDKDPKIRKEAYTKFYKQFKNHENTIASLLSGNVKQDVYFAKIKNFDTVLEKELFKDNVDKSVYHSLIKAVSDNLKYLHEYYDLKRDCLKQDRLNHWDAYAPITENVKITTPYEKAVDITLEATKILGPMYTSVLEKGLKKDRWCDVYENIGKRSGAFSAGGFIGYPYLFLNYDKDNIRSVLTLAHEAGHSMHSYFSSKNNPFSCYNYTIFEAEVASTFNEYLVNQYLMEEYKDDKEKLIYIISCQLDDILATLFRQTMFAEFELKIHTVVENGGVLTTATFRSIYKKLLRKYFGKNVYLPKDSALEGLRIPHFYRSYYVYKYATGISASIALAKKVTSDPTNVSRDNYLNFLKSGGSKFPIDSLKLAGVDMSSTEPVEMALKHFKDLLDKLKELLK